MRRLVWLAVVFALLWSGWWFFASSSLQAGIETWLAERRGEGWQAEVTEISMSGYPTALDAVLQRPVLADPQTGVVFEASSLRINASAFWPGFVRLVFPADEMIFASPEQRRTAIAQDAIADLRLHPGSDLELEELALTAGRWTLAAPEGTVLGAQALTLRMRQDTEDPTRYDFMLDAPAFQPGSVPRRALRVPADWPVTFDSLALDMSVAFDRAVDRTAIEVSRPQPRRIDLRLAEAVWGTLLIRSAATLHVTETGILNGEVSLQARNWQDMLTLAESAGTLPSAMRPQIENVLSALARSGGNPDTIDVTIAVRDGTMFMGFVPLGAAPRLILR